MNKNAHHNFEELEQTQYLCYNVHISNREEVNIYSKIMHKRRH